MTATAKLKVLKPYNGHKVGDIVEDDAGCARAHVAMGNAEYYTGEPEPEPVAVAAPRTDYSTRAMTPRKTATKTPTKTASKTPAKSASRYNRSDMRAED